MPGLERLLRRLYGTEPQIDLDQQFTRSRVLSPMKLDFHELADGMRRNNVALDYALVEVTASIENGQVVLQPTSQKFPLSGDPPKEPGLARRRFKVVGHEPGKETALQILR
jgi:hypothetical protein